MVVMSCAGVQKPSSCGRGPTAAVARCRGVSPSTGPAAVGERLHSLNHTTG